MSNDTEIDAVILGILRDSPHGRAWLEDRETKADYMRRCYELRKRGLSHRHTTALWFAGDADLLRSIESATDADLTALNGMPA